MTTVVQPARTAYSAQPSAEVAQVEPLTAGVCVAPPDYQLSIYRGDTYHWQFYLWADSAKTTPVDLTGATAKAEIRDKPLGGLLTPLTCVTSLPNRIDMTLSSAASHTAQAGVWDLQLTFPTNEVQTIIRGSVCITDDVTDSTP